jgi:hypothetical protein
MSCIPVATVKWNKFIREVLYDDYISVPSWSGHKESNTDPAVSDAWKFSPWSGKFLLHYFSMKGLFCDLQGCVTIVFIILT